MFFKFSFPGAGGKRETRMTRRRKKGLGRNLGPDLLCNARQTQQNVRQQKGGFCVRWYNHIFSDGAMRTVPFGRPAWCYTHPLGHGMKPYDCTAFWSKPRLHVPLGSDQTHLQNYMQPTDTHWRTLFKLKSQSLKNYEREEFNLHVEM